MLSSRIVQVIASGLSLIFLVLSVTAATYFWVPADSFIVSAGLLNLLASVFAIGTWAGALNKQGSHGADLQNLSCAGWLALFLGASLLSALLLFMDCGWHLPAGLGGTRCDGHPGLSIVFTLGSVLFTAIALPSALRAWLLEFLSR
jgi:hypothetical protein